MLFRKRRKPGAGAPQTSGGGLGASPGGLYRIDLDMMLKGSFAKRGGRTVRQYGVTVRGSTHLVTSGDMVDRETYEALLAVGAIRPQAPPVPAGSGSGGGKDTAPAEGLKD